MKGRKSRSDKKVNILRSSDHCGNFGAGQRAQVILVVRTLSKILLWASVSISALLTR
jgi:hypothetical protein